MKTKILALSLTAAVAAVAGAAVPALAGGGDAKAPKTAAPVSARGGDADVVAALDTVAEPLASTSPGSRMRDLDAFGAMVGQAEVVGVGEATHSTAEFYTLNHRLFQYLVARKGFGTFARELSWSTGVRLNDYVLHGEGDPQAIFHDEVKGPYDLFDNREFLDLVRWMRAHNAAHADKVQFMGADLLYPGDILFDKVLAYVKRHHPAQLSEFTRLYDGLRPITRSAGEYMAQAMAVPLETRQDYARRATRALTLLQKQGGADREYRWAVQHARALSQTFTDFAFDQGTAEGRRRAQDYRDTVLADNVAWWNATTGDKIQVSGLNAHVSYTPIDAEYVPAPMGGKLRRRLGARFVTVGTGFDRGGYNFVAGKDGCPANNPPAERPMTCKGEVKAAEPGFNEYVLDQVRHRDFILDTRTAPRTARTWLSQARNTYLIGGGFWTPAQATRVALGRSFDLVIHLHQVKAATLLP